MAEGEGTLPAKGNSEAPISNEINDLINPPKAQELRLATRYSEQFSGPLPHPRIMTEYERCLPGAADRIFQMAEKQQDHRMDLEQSVIQSDITRADLGLRLGFSLFLMFGIGAIILLAMGKEIGGYSLLGTSLAGGVANFIKVGRERQKAAQQDKQSPLVNRKKKKQHSRR